MHPFDFWTLGVLLLVACVVSIGSHKLRLPPSVVLVAAGVVLALLPVGVNWPLTRDLIFYIFLPPLVFEAAIQIPWQPFRRELPLLLALVTIGVALGAAVVAGGMHWVAGWSWLGAGFFGVLIAATDPVSVIAAFRTVPVEKRLQLLVESESLLNDGVAAVGFAVLAAVAAGGHLDTPELAFLLAKNAIGGVIVGAGVALPLILLADRTEDALVEITLTMLIAYGSFLLAEHLHTSGVLATLTAGMVVGNYGFQKRISPDGRGAVLHHWEFVAFLVNSVIFLLIGGHAVSLGFRALALASLLATALALAGRAATVYPLTLLFARSRLRVPWAYKHVLFWGGLRGALALALALALPESVAERGAIVTVSFAVVAFSIFVQGLTMPWLVRRLGLLEDQGTSTVSTASDDVSG